MAQGISGYLYPVETLEKQGHYSTPSHINPTVLLGAKEEDGPLLRELTVLFLATCCQTTSCTLAPHSPDPHLSSGHHFTTTCLCFFEWCLHPPTDASPFGSSVGPSTAGICLQTFKLVAINICTRGTSWLAAALWNCSGNEWLQAVSPGPTLAWTKKPFVFNSPRLSSASAGLGLFLRRVH